METYSRQRMLNILKASKSNNNKVMFVYRRIFNYVDEKIIFKEFILNDFLNIYFILDLIKNTLT